MSDAAEDRPSSLTEDGAGPAAAHNALGLQWAALVILVLVVTVALKTAQAPAAYLMGPLLIGIVFGVISSQNRLPPALRFGSQSLIGCIIAIALGTAAGPT